MSLIALTDWEELKRIEEFLDEGTPSIYPRVIDSLHELDATGSAS